MSARKHATSDHPSVDGRLVRHLQDVTHANLRAVDFDTKAGKRLDHELTLVLSNLPAHDFRNGI